jgi:hypothetical protein
MFRARRRRVTIALPGEDAGRRRFLVRGLLGGAALVAAGGGAGWLATRKTRVEQDLGALRVFSSEEASVLLAVADRLVPDRSGFPRPRQLGLASRMDAVAAMAHPATQVELRRLVRLFESPVSGLLLDGRPEQFTMASPPRQDRRLRAWSESRIGLSRTGFRALKRLVYAAYYSSPETWPAVGYPGPPFGPGAPEPAAPPAPPAPPAPAAPAQRPPAGEATPRKRAPKPAREPRPDPLRDLLDPKVDDG